MSKILLDGVSLALGREYTASSAYLLQFEGSISSDLATIIWEGWALGKCRFFIWTAAMNKVLTADALLLRGWENKYFCPLCMRNRENPFHLLVECAWSKQLWETLAVQFQLPSPNPNSWGGHIDQGLATRLHHFLAASLPKWYTFLADAC
jgi:hypothetical protein